jgi:hypothetical protein
MPNLPVYNITIRVLADGKKIKHLTLLPKGTSVSFQKKKDYVEFNLPKLDTYAMFELTYE